MRLVCFVVPEALKDKAVHRTVRPRQSNKSVLTAKCVHKEVGQRQSDPHYAVMEAGQQERAHCNMCTQRGGTKTERSTLRRDGGRATRVYQSSDRAHGDKGKPYYSPYTHHRYGTEKCSHCLVCIDYEAIRYISPQNLLLKKKKKKSSTDRIFFKHILQ